MEVIQYLAQLHLLVAAVAIMLLKMAELAGQAAVAAALAQALLVQGAQEIHLVHHQVKAVTVEMLLLTTAHRLLALVVVAALVGQQHQMAQMRQVQLLEMAQMEQHQAFLVLALHTLVVAAEEAVTLMHLAGQAAVVLALGAVVLVYQIPKLLV
jgi:hypothetical protein